MRQEVIWRMEHFPTVILLKVDAVCPCFSGPTYTHISQLRISLRKQGVKGLPVRILVTSILYKASSYGSWVHLLYWCWALNTARNLQPLNQNLKKFF